VPNERALKAFAYDVLNGLNEIHRNNVIHCDIKPHNFLLFNSGDDTDVNHSFDSYDESTVLKLTDFGLAHVIPLGSHKTLMKLRCGTFYYTAPEINNVRFD
jgi:serine/threonine protein kinase